MKLSPKPFLLAALTGSEERKKEIFVTEPFELLQNDPRKKGHLW
jgi:hypothetical protein